MCSFQEIEGAGGCSLDSYFKTKEDFSEDHWTLLQYRSRLLHLDSVCADHEVSFLTFFKSLQTFCVDPENFHPNVKKKVSTRITLNMYLKTRHKFPSLVPGHGLCRKCYAVLSSKSKSLLTSQISEHVGDVDTPPRPAKLLKVHQTPEFDSPLVPPSMFVEENVRKFPRLAKRRREQSGPKGSHNYVNQKIEETWKTDFKNLSIFLLRKGISLDEQTLKSACESKLEEIFKAIQMTLEDFAQRKICSSSDCWNETFRKLKDKYKTSESAAERFQILSLLPDSWSGKRIVEELDIGRYYPVDTTLNNVKNQNLLSKCSSHVELQEHISGNFQNVFAGDEMLNMNEILSADQSSINGEVFAMDDISVKSEPLSVESEME